MPIRFIDTAAAATFRDEKMSKVNLFESPRMFCDVHCLKPGQSHRVHTHADNDKIYHALTGTCRVQIGAESRDLPPGHLAVAPAGVEHGVFNESDQPATLLVIMAPHPTKKS